MTDKNSVWQGWWVDAFFTRNGEELVFDCDVVLAQGPVDALRAARVVWPKADGVRVRGRQDSQDPNAILEEDMGRQWPSAQWCTHDPSDVASQIDVAEEVDELLALMLGTVERCFQVLEPVAETLRGSDAERAYNACKTVQEKARTLGIKSQDPPSFRQD